MSRVRKKMAAGLLALAIMAIVLAGQVFVSYGATAKLTFSDPSVTVGNQVSVTMKITTSDGSLGASDIMVGYDSSALEFVSGTNANGGAGQVRVVGSMEAANQTTFSFTLKFKALKAGNTSLTVKSQEVYDADSQTVTLSHVGSSTVKVNAPVTYSKDASLSSLEISPGTLNPAFSSDVTEYTAEVSGVTSIAVSALANDSKANVAVSGNEGLQPGENAVECKVTAEDGTTTRSYTIMVTMTEGESAPEGETETAPDSVDASADTGNWTVADTFDESLLPSGFTVSQIDYNGSQVQSGTDANGNVILYMTDEDGNGDFFFYDTENNSLTPYVTVLMAEKTIIVLPQSAIPEGTALPENFKYCTIDIGTHTVDGWIWSGSEEAPEYCIVYGMNENGERNFYRYDQKEMTLQRYFQDPDAAETRDNMKALAENYNSLVEDYNLRGIIIAVLFGVCIIMVIIVIVLLLTRKSKSSFDGPRDPYDREKKPSRTAKKASYEERTERGAPRAEIPERRRTPGGYRGEELEVEELDFDDEEPVSRPQVRQPGGQNSPARNVPVQKAASARPADGGRERSGDHRRSQADQPEPSKQAAREQAAAKENDDDFEFIDLDL